MEAVISALLAAAGPALQQAFSQLMQSPQFHSVLQKILDDIVAKIAAGIHPDTAVKQATGQIGAAAMLHLTGNPVADLLSIFHPSAKPPVVTPPGTFTS
jgi:hypothetical protein